MHPGIRIVNEGSRGCGNRKLGGLYLVFDGPVSSCGKLPIPFEVCPCCVLPGTKIEGASISIENMVVGDICFGHSGKVSVTKTFEHNYSGSLVTIKAEGLLPITVTIDHPVMVISSDKYLKNLSKPHFVEAGEIVPKKGNQPGHYLVIPRFSSSLESHSEIDLLHFMGPHAKKVVDGRILNGRNAITKFPVNKSTAWLIGNYVADGSSSKKGVIFHCGSNERENHERLIATIKDIGFSPSISNVKSVKRIEIPSRILARAFPEWCGKDCYEKRVPEFILNHRDVEILKAFRDGYEAGDGYLQNAKGTMTVRSTTVSKQLAMELQILNARCGDLMYIYEDKREGKQNIEGRSVVIKNRYNMNRKVEGDKNLNHCMGEYIIARVSEVTTSDYDGTVFNIETSDNTYLLSNAVVHNCGEGIRFSRSPKWIEQPERLWNAYDCKRAKFEGGCSACPMSNAYESGPALLIWVGKQHYSTPRKFVQESLAQGISRRIKSIPRGFQVGKTWVLLAHEQAVEIERSITDVEDGERVYQAGIFGMMKPSRIEIIVTGDETDEEIEKYLERGLTPVKIEKPQPENAQVAQGKLL